MTAGAIAAGVFTGAAHAAAFYTWQQIAGSPTISNSSGSISFADSALPGPISYEYNGAAGPVPADPNAPFLQFGFSVTIDAINVRTFGFAADTSIAPRDIFRLTAVQSLGAGLTGRMFALNANGDEELTLLSDTAGLWTIVRAYNGQVNEGTGATGRWVLASGTVPEPGILSLLALGAFGVSVSMRRKRAAA